MGWFGDRATSVNAAFGPKRYMLAPLFGAIVGFADWVAARLADAGVSNLTGVPSWAIGLFVALLMIAWWLLEYSVTLRKRISGTRVGLSELREEGVKIRNAGVKRFSSEPDWKAWEKSANDWEGRVIDKIKEISEADGVWFKTLDVVPPPRITMQTAQHMELWHGARVKLYGEHDFRLVRLGEMIRELWRE